MQAMILAAGMGRRLGKYTQDGTKCMVCVNGKALIEHALEALRMAGIRNVVIVVGYHAERLRAFLDGRYPDVTITYVDNPDYATTNNIYSLWLARHHLAEDDTVLLESDIVFQPDLLTSLVADPEPNLAVVSKFEPWMDGTVTLIDQDRNILSVIDKRDFRWRQVGDYYKTVNIYKFSAEFARRYCLPFLDAYLASFGKNQYYEQVLKVLAFLEDVRLKAFPISGRRWYEIDDPNDLATAETIFASRPRQLDMFHARFGGYWRFPGLLDYCYLVNPFFPPPRLFEEMAASFRELLTRYPSGARVQSSLAGKVFEIDPERIVIGNGAAELIDAIAGLVPGTAAITVPSFNEYPARFGSDRTVPLTTADFGLSYRASDLQKGLAAADTLILVNPDNPTGHFLPEDEVKTLVDHVLEAGKRIIVDESFADFADEPLRFSLLDDAYLANRPGLLVLKSISKSYGVPGLRLGVLATGDMGLASAVRKALPVWNVNSVGEFFLQIVDKYKADYLASCNELADERRRFAQQVTSSGVADVYPSQANYLLCRLRGPETARALAERLLCEHRILIKDLTGRHGFPQGEFIRLAIRTPPENDRLVSALSANTKGACLEL